MSSSLHHTQIVVQVKIQNLFFVFVFFRGVCSLSQPRLNIFTVGSMRVMICLGQGGLRSLSASSCKSYWCPSADMLHPAGNVGVIICLGQEGLYSPSTSSSYSNDRLSEKKVMYFSPTTHTGMHLKIMNGVLA